MSDEIFEAQLRLTVKDEASPVIDKVTQSVDKLQDSSMAGMSGVKDAIGSLSGLSKGTTAAVQETTQAAKIYQGTVKEIQRDISSTESTIKLMKSSLSSMMEGTPQHAAQLQKLTEWTNGLASSRASLAVAQAKETASAAEGAAAAAKLAEGTAAVTEGTVAATAAMGGMAFAVGAVASIVAVAAGTAVLLYAAWDELKNRGIAAMRVEEQQVITMAAASSKTNDWAASTEIAGNALEKLKVTAATVGKPVDQLIDSYTQLKRTFGGTSEEAAGLIEKLAILARARNTSVEAITFALSRQAMTGQPMMRGAAGMALAETGINAKELQMMKDAGQALEYMNAKIADNPVLVAALRNTWNYLDADLARTKENLTELVGKGFEPLKRIYKEWIDTLKDSSVTTAVQQLSTNLKVLNEAIVEILMPGAKAAGGARNWLIEVFVKIVRDIAETVVNVKEQIQKFVAVFQWGKTMLAIATDGYPAAIERMLQESKKLGAELDAIHMRAQKQRNELAGWNNEMASSHKKSEFKTDPSDTKQLDSEAYSKSVQEILKLQGQLKAAGEIGADATLTNLRAARAAMSEEMNMLQQRVMNQENKDKEIKKLGLQMVLNEKQQAEAKNASALAVVKAQDTIRKSAEAYYLAGLPQYQKAQQEAINKEIDAETTLAETMISLKNKSGPDADAERGKAYWKFVFDMKAAEDTMVANRAKANDDFATLSAQANSVIDRDLMENVGAVEKAQLLYEKNLKALASMFAAKEISPAQYAMGARLQLDAYNVTIEEAQNKTAMATAAMRGDWGALWAAHANLVRRGKETFSDAMKAMADSVYKFGKTFADGVAGAFAEFLSTIKTDCQIAMDFIVGVRKSLEKNMSDGLVASFKGDTEAIKNTFKNLWDDILKGFADLIIEVTKKNLTKAILGDGSGGGGGYTGIISALFGGTGANPNARDVNGNADKYGWSSVDSSGGGSSQTASWMGGAGNVGSYAAIAGMAYGTYQGVAAIGQGMGKNNQRLSYGGADMGELNFGGNATMGPFLSAATTLVAASALYATAAQVAITTGWSLYGLIAAAVILLVGAILSIANGPAEGSFSWRMNGTSTSGIDPFTKESVGNSRNYVTNLARASGSSTSAAGSGFDKNFKEIFGNSAFNVRAGSVEDMQKDLENFFKQTLPKFAMQAAFGQYGAGMTPPGNRDAQGGMAGIDWNTNNGLMDRDGNWVKSQLYDPNAPIPLMLTGIGFTQAKIKDIAQKLSGTADIEKFKTWLTNLVTVVVATNTAIANMQKSANAIFAELDTAAHTGPVEAFKESAANIVELSKEIADYTGDEQISKAQELLQLEEDRYQQEVQYLAQIKQVMDAAEASIAALSERMQHWSETTDQTASRLWSSLMAPGQSRATMTTIGTLNLPQTQWQNAVWAAKTPTDIAKIEQEVEGTISKLFDYFTGLIVAGRALATDFRTLATDFRGISKTATPDTKGVWGISGQVDKIFNQIVAAEQKTGTERIAAMAQVRDAGKAMYASLLQTLVTIRQNADQLHKSIAAQIHDLDYQDMSPQQQAADLQDRIQKDMMALANAKTPEEVRRLTDEIQQLGGTYMQLFGPDDPMRKDAKDWLKKTLTDTDAIATQVYDNLDKIVTQEATRFADLMDKAGYDMEGFVFDAGVALDALTGQLGLLKDTVHDALLALGEEVIATNADLIPAMQALKTGFTDLNDIIGGPKGGPGKLGPDFQELDGAVRTLTQTVNAATTALGGDAP